MKIVVASEDNQGMSRVLVTGAGGYIGTTLVPMLLEAGHHVRAVDRFFFGEGLLEGHDRLEIVREDIRRLTHGYFEGVDCVVDLAALSNDPSAALFEQATWEINHEARVGTARMAKVLGCQRYILPSSCSVYGFLPTDAIADETTATNALTTYAQANKSAEDGVLPLADDSFCVVVLRQATVYGYSPRMRFDLAVNGMTFGAWKTGRLPLMRDGSQWRPMVHVRDAARAICFMLEAPADKVNGEIFNVGSDRENYRVADLGRRVADMVPRDVQIEWYGDPDHRSYRVSFSKIESVGFETTHRVGGGVLEICAALESGLVDRTPRTITLDWYRALEEWAEITEGLRMYGGLIDIDSAEDSADRGVATGGPRLVR